MYGTLNAIGDTLAQAFFVRLLLDEPKTSIADEVSPAAVLVRLRRDTNTAILALRRRDRPSRLDVEWWDLPAAPTVT